jgi:hypothetical protein
MSYPETNETRTSKPLCVESNNPHESTQWKFLWEFDEKDLIKTQELLDELNVINAPVQLRIAMNLWEIKYL